MSRYLPATGIDGMNVIVLDDGRRTMRPQETRRGQ